MVTTVNRKPIAVCAVSAVPTNRASVVSLSDGGEDARVGDDGGTPHQQKGDESDCRGGEEHR